MIPQTVPYLNDVVPHAKPGPLEPIDEIPTPHEYYNGGLKLNTLDISCKIITVQTECMKQSSCGWCGQTNSCILGNPFGPQEPCQGTSYIYSAPVARPINMPNFDHSLEKVTTTIISS